MYYFVLQMRQSTTLSSLYPPFPSTTLRKIQINSTRKKEKSMVGKTELVIVPAPAMGHLLSTVEVAKLILQRDHRISVVILIINRHLDDTLINAYVDSQSVSYTHLTLPTNREV